MWCIEKGTLHVFRGNATQEATGPVHLQNDLRLGITATQCDGE